MTEALTESQLRFVFELLDQLVDRELVLKQADTAVEVGWLSNTIAAQKCWISGGEGQGTSIAAALIPGEVANTPVAKAVRHFRVALAEYAVP